MTLDKKTERKGFFLMQKDDRNLDQKIYDGMKAFGARLFPPRRESTSDYVLDVYETSPMLEYLLCLKLQKWV